MSSFFLTPDICKVDSLLYRLYPSNDLRKLLYFKSNADGTYQFRGNYNGTANEILFNGLAVDEIYLIRAECRAMRNDIDGAMSDLNALARKRYLQGTLVEFSATSIEEALRLIMMERRKELAFRGMRWSDLRRFNLNGMFKDTLFRRIDNSVFTLLPDAPGYVLGLTNRPR
ncbi:RagB/SusD family nutrient uptake outer membrane protein [Chitinophaga horti]|uniref:RagB/SusD family nutrient uptake outer membrane protein n=1 Tax=Chitinophaga horti TaxID=2920382 RepID=A0ABY6J4V5_9BACT|nr:RagB/SusD family nutrient uptake outer membrane protein [Chitinophaga horti]UYQ94703.1 RagB/SusD family nutrient uptake outer membrane protein [Chitinophaga horti]